MATRYSPKIVTNGLVYCVDGSNPKSYIGTGTSVRDLTRSGTNGTMLSGASFNSANGGTFAFDGIDDGIIFANRFSIGTNFTGTIEFFFKGTGAIFSNYRSTSACGDALISLNYGAVTNNRVVYMINSNPGPPYEYLMPSSVVLSTSSYNYCSLGISIPYGSNATVTASGRYFINGSFENVTASFYSSNLQVAYTQVDLGRRLNFTYGNPTYLSGNIGCVRAYNRLLTDLEVVQNYNATKTKFNL